MLLGAVDKCAVDSAIHDVDPETGKSRGRLAFNPRGALVTLPLSAPLKPGWRYAGPLEIGQHDAPIETPSAIQPVAESDQEPA